MVKAKGLWVSQLATRLRGNPARCVAPRRRQDVSNLENSCHPSPCHYQYHYLELYDYEASPWCRLVREYATILDLQLHIKPCPRETLWQEGAFSCNSRFRPEAMALLQQHCHTDDLMFPILVDRTKSKMARKNGDNKDENNNNNDEGGESSIVVMQQSYAILDHLWKQYGQFVIPSSETATKRHDQIINDSHRPFALRFLQLAAPSYLRPWPHCGLFRIPSKTHFDKNTSTITLYQSEGCAESRLVRELLCSLEIPYLSIPVASRESRHQTSIPNEWKIPVMTVNINLTGKREPELQTDYANTNADSNENENNLLYLQGAADCLEYLHQTYGPLDDKSIFATFLHRITPEENLGRQGSFNMGAYTAFMRGIRAFVPS